MKRGSFMQFLNATRYSGYLIVVVVFVVEAMLFSYGRSETSAVLFGADAVWMTQAQGDAFGVTAANIPDLMAFASRLTGADARRDVPATVVFEAMSDEGRAAAHRLASGMRDARTETEFLLSLNRDIVDVHVPWQESLTAGLSPLALSQDNVRITNLQVLARHFGLVATSTAERSPRPLAMNLFSGEISSSVSELFRVARTTFDSARQHNRYTPLSTLYGILGQSIMLSQPDGERIVLFMAAMLYGVTWLVVFLLARRLIGSVPWAIFAVALAQLAPASLSASYMLFSLPYLLVVLTTAAALVGYMSYREDGSRLGLALFVAMGIAGPWVREFGSAIPVIVAACEILRFDRHRSPVILAICIPLLGHAVYPSFLPWMVGVSAGPVMAVLSQGKAVEQLNPLQLHFGFVATQFVQFPPVLWVILATAVVSVWWRADWRESGQRLLSVSWLWRSMAVIVAAVAVIFLFAFANPGGGHELDHPHWAYHDRPLIAILMLSFVMVAALSGFKFGVVAPIYFLAMFLPFLRLNLAEIHMVFTAPPMAIVLVQWARDLTTRIVHLSGGWQKPARTCLTTALILVAIDQSLNATAAIRGQRALVDTHMKIADDIRRLTPRYSIVITNFLAHPDIYYYSGLYFSPYQTTHNNPMGAKSTVFEKADMDRLLDANAGVRDIYFLEATPAYAPWRAAYHSHKWVHQPPGTLRQMAEYPVDFMYEYLDPLKWLTPTNFVSLPAYMDWETDLGVTNADRPFARQLKTRYVLYQLTPSIPIDD